MTIMTTMSIIIVATVITITTTATMTTVELGNIPQKPALSVVTSIDVSIGTEIISDSESHAYSADHPGHSKFNNSFKIKKHRYRESTKRNKVGIYRGRGGHPPETLTALGYHTFCIHGHCHGHRHGQLTALCPLSFLGNTALTQQFQFPVLSGLEPFSGRAVDAGLVKTEGLSGKLKGQLTVCPNPIASTAKKMGFLSA